MSLEEKTSINVVTFYCVLISPDQLYLNVWITLWQVKELHTPEAVFVSIE